MLQSRSCGDNNMEKRQTFSSSRDSYQSTQSSSSIVSTGSSALTWNNASIEPQTNSELFQQLQELNKDVDTTAEFVCGVNDIICATVPANVFLAALGCFAIAEIIMGTSNLSECPVEPKIPIFLFVGGCFALLKIVHMLWTNYKLRRHSNYVSETDNGKSQRTVQIVDGVLNIFLLTWQGIGIYWAFNQWLPNWEAPLHDPDNWCNEGVYVFTIVQIILAACITVVTICFQGCLWCCYKYTDVFEG